MGCWRAAYNVGMQLSPAPDPQSRNGPTSLTDLFWTFTALALQGFGGVLAIAQRDLVEKRRWFTREEFLDEWSVAQIMPGSNMINLALMVGGRYYGLRGALSALAGMLTGPMVVLLLLAVAYSQLANNPGVAGALRGMGAVAAGLLMGAGVKLAPALKVNPLGLALCALLMVLTFVAIALLRWPLMLVIPALGVVACMAAWFALRNKEQ